MIDIEDLRKKRKISQQSLASRVGITQSQYSRLIKKPENITIGMMNKIREALSLTQHDVGEIFITKISQDTIKLKPGNPYCDINKRKMLIKEYMNSVKAKNKMGLEKFTELEFLLNKLSRKPNLLLLGHYDVGKTRLVNHLLGDNIFPTNYSPTTKVLTIIKHKEDKYSYMKQEKDVWIFKNDTDINKIDDVNYIGSHYVNSGDVSLLKQYATINDASKENENYFVLAFIESDFLKACNIIDTPGFGNQDIDDNILNKILANSTLMMDVLLYASNFTGFLDNNDFEVLTAVLNRLPKLYYNETNNKLKNLFIIATHADPSKTDKQISELQRISAERLFKVFGSTLFSDLEIINKDVIKKRIFPFWAESEGRNKFLEKEILYLLENIIPKIIKKEFKEGLKEFKDTKSEELQKEITFIQNNLNKQDKAKSDYEKYMKLEPERSKKVNEELIVLNEFILNLKKDSKIEINNYINNKLEIVNIKKFIKDNFKKKKEAQKILIKMISEKFNFKLKNILEVKSKELNDRMEKFFNDYYPNQLEQSDSSSEINNFDMPFNARGAFIGGLSGLATIGAYIFWVSTLGNLGGYILVAQAIGLLSSLGISLSAAGAMSFVSAIGGPITLAIGIGIIVALGVFNLFGASWEDRLAKTLINHWNKKNTTNKFLDANDKFWEDTILALNSGFANMEREWQQILNKLREISNPENKTIFEKDIKELGVLKSFFEKIPLD